MALEMGIFFEIGRFFERYSRGSNPSLMAFDE